jgi:hypothetical protein
MAISLDSIFNNTTGTINKNVGSMKDWINNQNIPDEQKQMLQVQSEMQRMQEMVQLATTLMKSLHEMSKSVIQNMAV